MSCSKRLKFDEVAVNSIKEPKRGISVEGVLVKLSDIKTRKNDCCNFSGILKDSTGDISFVCFEKAKYQVLEKSYLEHSPVKIKDVNIKRNSSAFGGQLEMFINPQSEVEIKKSMDSNLVALPQMKTVTIENLVVCEMVSIKAKVLKIEMKKITVAGKSLPINKQILTVADSTSIATMSLWDKNIDMLELNKAYLLTDVKAVKYADIFEIQLGRYSRVEEIKTEFSTVDLDSATVICGEIYCISNIQTNILCAVCKGVLILSEKNAKCTNCKTTFKLSKVVNNRQISVVLGLEQEDGKQVDVLLDQNCLSQIPQITVSSAEEEITDALLDLGTVLVKVNTDMVVKEIKVLESD